MINAIDDTIDAPADSSSGAYRLDYHLRCFIELFLTWVIHVSRYCNSDQTDPDRVSPLLNSGFDNSKN